MKDGPIVVVKLGGSLLGRPEWPGRLASFLNNRPVDRVVVIVGGGPFADLLRGFDQAHALGEVRSHALALRLLDATARIAAALLPGSVVAEELDELTEIWEAGKIPILAPRRFLDGDDQSPDPLPHAWTTTTDSIAARVARHLAASELVLLKSVPLPPDATTWEAAAALELVDPEFPRAVRNGPLVRFVDFRDPDRGATLSTGIEGSCESPSRTNLWIGPRSSGR